MKQDSGLASEERDGVTEIQDLLIARYVELKEAREKGDRARAKEIETAIADLHVKRKKIGDSAIAY